MQKERTVSTDELLVEFTGDLAQVVIDLGRLERGFDRSYPPKDDPWWDTSRALEEYQELLNRLQSKAPEGYYFGGHPNQPQCLGFWPTQ